MHQFRSFAYLLIALLNIFLSIPLCKRFEGIGCSIGTAVSLVIGNGWIMNWYYSKKMKLDIRYFWSQILKILPALIFPLVYGMVVTTIFPVNSVVTFIIELVLFLGLFVWSLHSLGMNEEEKQLFYNLINKVRNLKK
jgi:O-antigen/teichoic acid export membrane protein